MNTFRAIDGIDLTLHLPDDGSLHRRQTGRDAEGFHLDDLHGGGSTTHYIFLNIPLTKVFSAADLKGAQPGGQRPDGPGADHVEAGQVVHHGQEVDVGVQLYVRVKRSVEKFSLSSFGEGVVQAIYGKIRWNKGFGRLHFFY